MKHGSTKELAAIVVKELRQLLTCVPCDGAGFGYLGECAACKGRGHVRDQVKTLIASVLPAKQEIAALKAEVRRLGGDPARRVEFRRTE
jgi:DnaJ-class molecular chaperone